MIYQFITIKENYVLPAPISLENPRQKTSTRVDAKNGISKMFVDELRDRQIRGVVP